MFRLSKLPSLVLLGIIWIYQKCISPFLGKHCCFEPTCSQYAKEALQEKGLLRGCYLSFTRILRCHPWAKGGFDPLNKHYRKKSSSVS